MKSTHSSCPRGFTLLETVIAIGVLAVLLTGFMVVFAPAADGIRKSINVQQADRLASSLEQELVTLRETEKSASFSTGFDKAFQIIEDSMKSTPDLVFVYQYRGDLTEDLRDDGTYEPYTGTSGVAGKDYAVMTMARRINQLSTTGGGRDSYFEDDLKALEGRVFAVRLKQLVFSGSNMVVSTQNRIRPPNGGADPGPGGTSASADYPEAVIAFSAEFFSLQSTNYTYIRSSFDPSRLRTPMFVRNMAVRR